MDQRAQNTPGAYGLAEALAACPPVARTRLQAALAALSRLPPSDLAAALTAALRDGMDAPAAIPVRCTPATPRPTPGLIPPHGGYEALASYRTAEIAYDATVVFCDRFIDRHSRTHDQMVQAARSGKQNLAEGSVDSATSKKLELKLVGVARGSLEELLRDYTDFLRQRGLAQWHKNDPRARAVRRLAYVENRTYKTYETYVRDGSAEVAANAIICLIHQANYLVDRQLQALEQAFLRDGGFTERLYAARQQQRRAPRPS